MIGFIFWRKKKEDVVLMNVVIIINIKAYNMEEDNMMMIIA